MSLSEDQKTSLAILFGAAWISIGFGFAVHSFWWGFTVLPISFKFMSWRS